MKILAVFISTLLLYSCINEDALNINFPVHYLHNNSAKVWVLSSSSYPKDKNVKAMKEYRKSFIFYANGSFREQELIHLGSNKGYKGKYRLKLTNNSETLLTLHYTNNINRRFIIQKINNKYLSLKSRADNHTIWELHSLKPPKL